MASAILLEPERWPEASESSSHRNAPIWSPIWGKIHDQAVTAFARAVEDRPTSSTTLRDNVNITIDVHGHGTHKRNRMHTVEVLRFLLRLEPARQLFHFASIHTRSSKGSVSPVPHEAGSEHQQLSSAVFELVLTLDSSNRCNISVEFRPAPM